MSQDQQGSVRVRRVVATVLAAYIAVVGVAAVTIGIWSWRVADRAEEGESVPAELLAWDFDISGEISIFLVVVSFGVMGGVVHMATSFVAYLGNRRFVTTWTAWYAFRPLLAAVLAVLVYVVFRAGFLPSAASTEDVNLYGVAAIAGLTGMFSKQVIDKLDAVMELVFSSRKQDESGDKLDKGRGSGSSGTNDRS